MRLRDKYANEVVPALKEQFGLDNPMTVARLQKITINMGLGDAGKDKRLMAAHTEELSKIAGQKPVVCLAKRSAATFKLRTGDPIGVKVTLRGERMWYFLEKVINIAAPRIRDFNGFKHGFDRRGNYTFGLNDQTIFPEIRVDKTPRQQGMDICFTISGGSDDQSKALLEGLGFPLMREPGKRKAKKKKSSYKK